MYNITIMTTQVELDGIYNTFITNSTISADLINIIVYKYLDIRIYCHKCKMEGRVNKLNCNISNETWCYYLCYEHNYGQFVWRI
jgi:hypothetical protein